MPTPLSIQSREWNRHSCLYELLSTQTAAPQWHPESTAIFFDAEALRIIHFQERAAGVAEDLRHFGQVSKKPQVPAKGAWLCATCLPERCDR
jgi:hypothetical protein